MGKEFNAVDIRASGDSSSPQFIIGDEASNYVKFYVESNGTFNIEPQGGVSSQHVVIGRFSDSGTGGTSNVGIGTTTPSAKLTVRGGSVDSANDAFRVEDSGSTAILLIEDGGNVGIGTSSPSAKFDIVSIASGFQLRVEGNNGNLFTVDDGVVYGSKYFKTSGNGNGFTFNGDTNVKFHRLGAGNAAVSSSVFGATTAKQRTVFLGTNNGRVGIGKGVADSWDGNTVEMPATVMIKGENSTTGSSIMQVVDSIETVAMDIKVGGDVFIAGDFSATTIFANAINIENNLKLQGNISFGIISADTSVSTSNEVFIGLTDTSTTKTITILSADIVKGRVFIIKDESGLADATNSIIVVGEGTETIDGAANAKITSNYGVLRLYVGVDGNLYTW